MNIYLSSSSIDKKEIKRLYKKYNDLPNNIIKEIIEYKLNQQHKIDYIDNIRRLDVEIKRYKKAIEGYISLRKNIITISDRVCIPCDDNKFGYCTMVDKEFAMKHLEELIKIRKENLQDAGYEYFCKRNNI